LRWVETVVIDEVHALAGNKRGAYLALCLESLEAIVREPLVRVGLSATVAPLERVAAFLTGEGRPCAIVDERRLRSLRLQIDTPFSGAVAPLARVAERCVELGRDVRTQLIFVNVRSQAERLAHEMALAEKAMPRPRSRSRARMRRRVRAATPRSASTTARSNAACAIASRRVARGRGALGRVQFEPRTGRRYRLRRSRLHRGRGARRDRDAAARRSRRPSARRVADGVIVAQDRDDVLEAAATRRCIADGVLEEIVVPDAPLDVLAQWLVLSVCYDRRVPFAEALAVARRAYPYRTLEEARCAALRPI
jgi:ATP-dependent Lhr-like helicase